VTTSFPLRHEASGHVAAPPALLFEHLDDPHRLSAHMEQPSMRMLGTSMSLATDAQGGRTVGSVIRMEGRVFGIRLHLEEVVTKRAPPTLKAWETLGEPQLLVIGAYRMGFRIAAEGGGSLLAVSIEYALPAHGWLGRLLGPAYARWCCRRMVRDAQEAFAPDGAATRAGGPLA
jgi:hypothetical protein